MPAPVQEPPGWRHLADQLKAYSPGQALRGREDVGPLVNGQPRLASTDASPAEQVSAALRLAAYWRLAWEVATSGKLDGYRALGAKAAAAETRADALLSELVTVSKLLRELRADTLEVPTGWDLVGHKITPAGLLSRLDSWLTTHGKDAR